MWRELVHAVERAARVSKQVGFWQALRAVAVLWIYIDYESRAVSLMNLLAADPRDSFAICWHEPT